MGSSGSNRFKDYGFGRTDGFEAFPLDFVKLEDVAVSEYFQKHQNVPAIGTHIRVRGSLFLGRLVVEMPFTGEIVGNIPTKYNIQLLSRIHSGEIIEGTVIYSHIQPLAEVVVKLE